MWGMENRRRNPRGRRKENIPPRFSSCVASEQRNVQKNININLWLDAGSHTPVSHRRTGAAVPESNQGKVTACATSVGKGGTKPQPRGLVQTNLPSPYWPFRDDTSGFPGSAFRQQSNLDSKLQRRVSDNVAHISDPPTLPVVNFGPSRCHSDNVGLGRNPQNDFSDKRPCWNKASTEGFGPCELPRSCSDLSERRTGGKERPVSKQLLGCRSVWERSGGDVGVGGDSFSDAKLSMILSPGLCLHDGRPPPLENSARGVDSSAPGLALTVGDLSSSTLLENDPSREAFQALVRSSQTSAELHGSIQRLKREAASMGGRGSSPWEAKASPLCSRSRFDAQVSTAAGTSVLEEGYAKQASVKWQAPFARDWGLGSAAGLLGDAEPVHVGYGGKNAGWYMHPAEATGQLWPTGFCGGISPTTLAFQSEEGYPNAPFCYFAQGWCSGVQKVLEGKGTCGPRNAVYYPRVLDPEERSSRLFRCSEQIHRDLQLGLPSIHGLELSLETSCAGTPVNVGVAVYDAQRELRLTVGSPRDPGLDPAGCFVDSSKELGVCEPEEVGGTPVMTYSVDNYASFLPRCEPRSFEVAARAGVEEQSWTDRGIATTVAGRSVDSQNSVCVADWPDAGSDPSEESSTEKDEEKDRLLHCEERCHVVGASPKETQERDGDSMEGRRNRLLPQRKDRLLEKCFRAWRDHVFGKRRSAEALYERQLLRKGLCALKWAVQLRHVQAGTAERSHTSAVLAASFQRWQRAAAKRQASRQEAATPSKELPAAPRGERLTRCPTLSQLSAEHQEEATQYGRAEGNLWMQHHRTQGRDKLCGNVQAVRDVRRLAAAFRLWCLQKERLEKEESRAREARALLEKKRLRGIFGVWRSRSRASQRVLPLAARIQRGLLSRCFDAWKRFAEREALCRHSLERQRAGSLRLCFQQWGLMAQVRERARTVLMELFALRQRKSCGGVRLDEPVNAPEPKLCWNFARQSQRNGADALEGLYHVLGLQAAFWTWRERWQNCHRADAFHQALAQRQLRGTLQRWRWKALHPNPLEHRPEDLDEESLRASLDFEESSLSSGFHSDAPPLLAFGGSLEKEGSLSSSSQSSISSLATLEDSGLLPRRDSLSPRRSLRLEDLTDGGRELRAQEPSPLRNGLTGAFVSCSAATAHNSAQCQVPVRLEGARQQRLLALCFEKWKAAFLRAERRREEQNHPRKHSGQGAVRRWRKAVRSYGALRSGSVTKACNYWTRAAAFSLFCRHRSGLVAARKSMKMLLSWTVKHRSEEKRLPPSGAICPGLMRSSCRVWLTVYRCRGRRLVSPRLPPQEDPGLAAKEAWIQESDTEPAPAKEDGRRLGRKYLRLWRHQVHLRHFQEARKTHHLAKAWLFWKDACRTGLAVHALVRERLLQQGWQTWRRRCLQSWVAERFLEAEDRRLLRTAFGRWQELAAGRVGI